MVWAGRKADDPSAVAAARTAMLDETEDEYRRLLYVAMTRAADRLIVGGCMPGNMNSVRKFSWYDLIVTGLGNSGLQLQDIETANGMRETLFAARGCHGFDRRGRRAGSQHPDRAAAWLRGAAPAEAAADNLLRPSDPAADEAHPVRSGESIPLRARALLRGSLVHRLLQSLPDVAAGTPPRCGAAVSRPQHRRRLDRG